MLARGFFVGWTTAAADSVVHNEAMLSIASIGSMALSAALFAAPDLGPKVGDTFPAFEAPDQNGQVRRLADLGGPSGLLLVFHRSADW